MSEFAFIGRLLQRLAAGHAPNAALPIGPGDDMAEAVAPGRRVLLAADMLLEGVHFDLAHATPELVGRKALAVNLSDVAAMAGEPREALVSLALPRRGGAAVGGRVMDGMIALAKEHGVAIAGGDTNAWDGPLVVAVAVTGTPHAKGSVTRGGARPGDAVCVTGALGGSIFGRHLTFAPRLAEAALLHARYGLSAMLDLSDGLGSDLRHVLAASGCGAVLDEGCIPVHPDVGRHASGTPLDHALSDGEDFELCFTLPADAAARLIAAQPFGPSCAVTRIGEITAAPGLRWRDGRAIEAKGYAHAFS